MLPPELSARFAEAGTLPLSIWALTRNSTSDTSSQATTANARYSSPFFQVSLPNRRGLSGLVPLRSEPGRSGGPKDSSSSPRSRALRPRGAAR